jgi:hypothetical protein
LAISCSSLSLSLPTKEENLHPSSFMVFWVMTPCSIVGDSQCFGSMYHLHLQGEKRQLKVEEMWRVSLKHCQPPTRLHNVITQKKTVPLFNSMKTSNFTLQLCVFYSIVQ